MVSRSSAWPQNLDWMSPVATPGSRFNSSRPERRVSVRRRPLPTTNKSVPSRSATRLDSSSLQINELSDVDDLYLGTIEERVGDLARAQGSTVDAVMHYERAIEAYCASVSIPVRTFRWAPRREAYGLRLAPSCRASCQASTSSIADSSMPSVLAPRTGSLHRLRSLCRE